MLPCEASLTNTLRRFLKVFGGPVDASGVFGLLGNQEPAKGVEIRTKESKGGRLSPRILEIVTLLGF